MKKPILVVVRLLLSSSLFAAPEAWRNGERVPLWPEGKIPHFQEHQIGEMTDEAGGYPLKPKEGFDAAAHRMPYLEWFAAPTNANGGCMILISGGSYQNCCDVGLIKFWRDELTKIGFQCVNLVYRTPRAKGLPCHQSAWEDGQRAVRLVRRDAKKRGFDPEKIGVIGMSAGGHLTCLLATISQTPAYDKVDDVDETPCHINWAIPNAPAYNTLNGSKGDQSVKDGVSVVPSINPVFTVDAKTCPMCFHHGGNDPWSPNGSTLLYRELRKRGIPAELHLYADKPHGAHGFERALEFIRQMNYDGRLAGEVRLEARFPDDRERGGYEKMPIWPEGLMPDVQTNQCLPYLEWHFPKVRTTKAIQIIYSGGSYMGNSPDSFEVAPARRYLNAKGMTVVTMRYRTPRPLGGLAKHTTAWQDLQRAIRVVRSRAAERGLDPERIGIMGSSAGGHLTLMGATSSRHQAYRPIDALDRLPCSVRWAIAIYPAYALTDGLEHPNVNGGNGDDARLAPEFSFDLDTCPILFIHGDADGWAAMNSVACWEQLRRMGIQGDLHTLVTRKHCFQAKASPGTGSYTWMDRIWEFMNHKDCQGRAGVYRQPTAASATR